MPVARPAPDPTRPDRGRSCFVLGSGRSGTSLLAGAIARAGHHAGDDLVPPRAANPGGFFEDRAVNRVNEHLLGPVVRPRAAAGHRDGSDPELHSGQRWLAQVPVGTAVPLLAAQRPSIEALLARRPFCYKDPRFCYTLAAWQACLEEEPVYLCVFREPGRTAASMCREAQEPYLADVVLDRTGALAVWDLMYRHVLEVHSRRGAWLFVHYDQLLAGEGFDRVEALLGAPVDRTFADPALRRSPVGGDVGPAASRTYAALCARAGYAG